MRIIAFKALREFGIKHPNADQALRTWYRNAKRAVWKSPADVKNTYGNASIVAHDRVVFNIKGNDYRLVVAIDCAYEIVYIRFVGTHREYDRIDVTKI